MERIDNMAALDRKLDQLEKQGLTKQADEIRKKFNIQKNKTQIKTDEKTDDRIEKMLTNMWTLESDPDRKEHILKMIAMKKAGFDNNVILMSMTNYNPPQKPQDNEFTKLAKQAFLAQLTANMSRDPIKEMSRLASAMPKKSNMESLEEYINNKKLQDPPKDPAKDTSNLSTSRKDTELIRELSRKSDSTKSNTKPDSTPKTGSHTLPYTRITPDTDSKSNQKSTDSISKQPYTTPDSLQDDSDQSGKNLDL